MTEAPPSLADLLGRYYAKLVENGIEHDLAEKIILDAAQKAHTGEFVLSPEEVL